MPEPYRVLFLCTSNAARSILAEAILNREGQGRFIALSAGSHPTDAPDPFALSLLDREAHATGFAHPKPWSDFAAAQSSTPDLDFVFTLCDSAAAEACPAWPGHPMTAHWGLPDPAAAEGSDAQKALAFAATYRALLRRIQAFCALPLSTIDALSLQGKLKDIGRA